MRLGIFRMRSLTVANVVMLLVAGGLFAMFFFASLYVQEILGYTPLKAGLAFLPVTLGIVVGAGLAQQLDPADRRARRSPCIGMVLAAIGLLVLSRASRSTARYVTRRAARRCSPMSIGMGMTFVPLTLIATTNVADEDAGLASGLFNTSQQVGGALGLAVLSTLAANRTSHVLGGGRTTRRRARRGAGERLPRRLPGGGRCWRSPASCSPPRSEKRTSRRSTRAGRRSPV